MKYFDTHAHYYDERFEEEYEGGAKALLSSLNMKDVSFIVNVGTAPETCRLAIEQARAYENMYTALGIHPSDARFIDDVDAALDEVLAMIKDSSSKCVALGEIGLDYHYEETNKEMQIALFRRQMAMAQQLGLPVVIHDRDAHEDVMAVIRDFPAVRGVMHSFSGSAEMALELVKLGYYISFSGTLTFTNARKPREVAAVLPHDRVLIETDCPYLTPHPHRGKTNHSGYLSFTNATLADIFGISEEECARITEENARRVFGI